MPNLLRRIAVVAAWISALGAPLCTRYAQNSNPEGYAPTTINVQARIVVLDVVVTDKQGKLVSRDDLSPGDFEFM